MVTFFQPPVSLAKKDFTLFRQLFCRKVNLLLPVSGAVCFWGQDENWFQNERAQEMLGKGYARLPSLCSSLEPVVIDSALVIPVVVEDDDNIGVIVGEMDSGLLRKMAPEWLQELRENVQQELVQAKHAYIYPETGLYSSRLLNLMWDEGRGKAGAFFLIGAPDRARSTRSLMKVIQTAHLLEATMNRPVIYFGGNVLGVYQGNISRESGLHVARHLLGRLKREGLHRVHIGITLVREQEEKSYDQVLNECWQALEIAEQRGPFSLCEASFLHNRESHPLAPPSRAIAGKLQNKWRGLKRFCLLLIRVEGADGKEKRKSTPLEQLIKDSLPNTYFFVSVSSTQCYMFLPGLSANKALPVARQIKNRLDEALHPGQVAVGLSYWPCQDFFRTAAMVNCRKALMHGCFFGPGSVTLFDHVSLNVSGDYFFDEGDYRQAVRDYRAGLKMNPNEVNLLNSLGVTLTELNKLNEAVYYFDLVLEKEPRNFMALVNKGFALRMLKRKDEALVNLSAAEKCKEFSSSPVSSDVSLQLGRLYCARGQYKQAVRILEKMVSRNSGKNGYLLYSLLGGAYAETGQNKKAIGVLQEAIRYNPHDAESLSILGDLYGAEEQGDDIALSLCTQAVKIDDQSWKNWYRLAKVRSRVADYDGAQEAARESLRINRQAVEAAFLAGKMYAKNGNKKQATKMFQQVLREVPDFPGASRALQKIR